MNYTTAQRFSNGYINIAATTRQTAKLLELDEVSAGDIALELACQGLTIVNSDDGIVDANKHTISLPQIKRALSNGFYHCGNGYYANSDKAVRRWAAQVN